MNEVARGVLRKMCIDPQQPARYALPVGDEQVSLNPLLGQRLRIEFLGEIRCIHCDRLSKKSFGQGYCYPCFRKLARCDSCIIKPEQCHYFEGTCREPEWGDANCMIDHFVYLAHTSGLKVGITRHSQVPTRWLDQGASQALPILRVSTRQQAGLAEVALARHVADKTNWRALLKPPVEDIDLQARRDQLLLECDAELESLRQRFGVQAIQPLPDADLESFRYPSLRFPDRIQSRKLEKQPVVEGTLIAIRGQYLMFEQEVVNIRNHTAYSVSVSTA